MRRTKSEAAKTREKILDVAEQAFLEKGVSQTSMNDIAKRANVSRGAIYFYFADKLAIFYAIIDRARFPQEQLIEQVQENHGVNPIDIMQEAAIQCLQTFANDERQQRILTIITLRCEYVEEFQDMIVRFREAYDGMLSIMERLLLVAKQRSMLAEEWEAKDAACAFVITINAVFNEWLYSGKSFDLQSLGKKMIIAQINAFRKR